MRNSFVLMCLTLACLSKTQAAVHRRGDKVSAKFRQLHLAPEEIDPDVEPIKIGNVYETTDENYAFDNQNEIIEESDNDIFYQSDTDVPQAAATAIPLVITTLAPATVESTTTVKPDDEPTGLAKYCKCKESHCDCCREFHLPFIPVRGPGCARMSYLGKDKMGISLKYGDLTLATRTISTRRARPVCVGLPGGYSQFCGRIYGLSKAKENFKACLGFELRAEEEVEAALRVSCFKFGPEGLKVAEAEPLPIDLNKEEDDDDDIFGFGGADDEEDEDEYDEDEDEDEEADDDTDADTDYTDDEGEGEAAADADYGGFSLAGFLDELDDDDDEDSKPTSTSAPPSSSALALRTAEDAAQSKDDKGTAAVTISVIESTEPVAATAVSATAEQDTSIPESTPNAAVKTKKSKKARRNKKKKAADTEGNFAYEFLNGLLDYFN